MKKVMAASTLVVLSTIASSVQAGGVEVRLGGFFPAATSNIFTDANELYALRSNVPLDPDQVPPGISRGDWGGLLGGAEFFGRVARNVEVGFHVDGYGQTLDTVSRDWVHPDGSDIAHKAQMRFIPVGVSIRLINTSRRARVAPYVSFGGDLVYYRYTEDGEFVNYDNPSDPVDGTFFDSFHSSGWLPGAHVAGGVRFPLGDDFRFSVEGKYLWTAREFMNGNRYLNEIDASGFSVTGGFSVRF